MYAWIGLGSNIGEPPVQLQRAVDALASLPGTKVIAISPVYRNPPLQQPGQAHQGQPDYLNAVAQLDTALTPPALLDALQAIEQAQGRVRREHWSARTLDLDLLVHGNTLITSAHLTLPHPGITERRFVLQPLYDIAPTLTLPDGRAICELLAHCPPSPLVREDDLCLPH